MQAVAEILKFDDRVKFHKVSFEINAHPKLAAELLSSSRFIRQISLFCSFQILLYVNILLVFETKMSPSTYEKEPPQ